MTAYTKTSGQEAEKKGFLARLSLRNKIIMGVLLVVALLLIISIPGDRTELLARQTKVDAAQVAYDLALPAVSPILENIIAFIDETGADVSENRSYSGLNSTLTAFNRDNATIVSRFQSILTFSGHAHSLLDGPNAVPELDADAFRLLVAEMDTTLSVAWSAMADLNIAIDEYNGYYTWISARIAGALFDLPDGYPDPVPATSRLNSQSLIQ